MTHWKFSDGTVVQLGGDVEGASLFAQRLRVEIADEPLVGFDPIPSPAVALDVNDVTHMDVWLRMQMRRPSVREMKLRLLEAPADVPDLSTPQTFDPDVVY